jgi:hypothetical protein
MEPWGEGHGHSKWRCGGSKWRPGGSVPCGPVVSDSHLLEEKQDPDPHRKEKMDLNPDPH